MNNPAHVTIFFSSPSPAQTHHTLESGVYRHYKGNYYAVICVAEHTETTEKMVIYQSLYDDFSLWSRPLEMFKSDVVHNGISQPRFIKVASQEEANNFINHI